MSSISQHQRIAILSPIGRHGGQTHGGITPVVLGIARGFRELGISVDMLTPFADGADNTLDSWGLDVGLHSLAGNHCQRRKRLKQYLQQTDCAGLICAGHRMNSLGCQFASSTLPVVTTVHNNMSRSIQGKSFLKTIALRKQLRCWQKKSKKMVAVSQGVAEDLKNHFGIAHAAVIHNAIDIERIRKRSQEEVDHPWFEDGALQVPVIVAVGRLTEQKDFVTLIRAFDLLNTSQSARLLILGEGEQRKELEALVSDLSLNDVVQMPGFVENPFAYVAKSQLFCLSSAWEGFGNVIVEAMAVGTPVVSTDCPSGPAEILQNGEFGILTPVGDVEALSDALSRGMSQDALVPDHAIAPFACRQVATSYASCLGFQIDHG